MPTQRLQEHYLGKPGSDQAFAVRLRNALRADPQSSEFLEALSEIRKAAATNDAEFFQSWSRGCMDLRKAWSFDNPDDFLLTAYTHCTLLGRKTSQSEVIRTAKRIMALAHKYGDTFPLQIEEDEAEIALQMKKLNTIGWKARIKKFGLTFALKAKRGRPKGWRKH
jgi:hypothetical protein